MKFTSLARFASAVVGISLLSSVVASAGVVRVGGVHAVQRPHLSFVGARQSTTCPSQYISCLTISKSSPGTQEWCIIDSGSGCTDLAPGTWTWTAEAVTTKKGKKTKKIKADFSPNPGNPTNLTVSTTVKKSTKGKIKYAVEFEACNSSSSCVGPALIGIIIS
jgi:hypothetical protein